MVRPTRPRKIGNHTSDDMKNALKKIRNGMSVRNASKQSGIPFTTLRRYYVKTRHGNIDEVRLTPNYRVNKIFNEEQETMLKEYFKHCALLFYGLSAKECRRIAYQMAIINNLKMPDSWKEHEMAGKDWLLSFRKRNRELSLRRPEACSLARATAFNRANVGRFYDNLQNVIKRSPSFADGTRIYNLDETSTTTVQKPQRVIAPKGRKNIGKVTSGERGTLVTTCCIISASGIALPPVMVFPRKNFKDFMIKNTPPGTLGLASPTGWINSQVFPEVMRHFIKHTNTTPENPSVLIMDNHESHLSIEALDIAKASGVHVLTLHPHTSGKLQPLDVGIYGPFKTYYNGGIDAWMMRNPGKPVTIYDIGEIVGNAFLKVMTPVNITKAFKASGIFPFDRNLFDDDDFLPSSVTDRPCADCLPREEVPTTQRPASQKDIDLNMPGPSTIQVPYFQDVIDLNMEGPSTIDLTRSAATIRLSTQRRSGSSDVTICYEEDASTLPSHNVDRNSSPSVLQPSNDAPNNLQVQISTTFATQGESFSDLHGNPNALVELPLPLSPLLELNDNTIPVASAEPTSSNVDKNTNIISPFQFRDPIKAGPRKSTRKPRKLGKSLIATDTPEKLEIEAARKNPKKRNDAKKSKTSRKVLQSDSEEENVDPVEIQYQESDEDNNWPDEELEDDPVPITANHLKGPLSHIPQEGEYVLVEFATKKTVIYYIGKILESRNRQLEYCISFLRQKNKNKFHLPIKPDVS